MFICIYIIYYIVLLCIIYIILFIITLFIFQSTEKKYIFQVINIIKYFHVFWGK